MTIGRRLLRAAKEAAVAHGTVLSLPVGRPVEAILRPVTTREGFLNAEDVQALTQWRNRFVRSFLTEFEATDKGAVLRRRSSRYLNREVVVVYQAHRRQHGGQARYVRSLPLHSDIAQESLDAVAEHVRGYFSE
jgi:hypothetical protein